MHKHTPEPWCTNGREIGDEPMMYTKISNSISGNSYEEAEANAHRIVACVNACAGMGDPEMVVRMMKGIKVASSKVTDEGAAITFDFSEAVEIMNEMAKQRDELLAALEKCRKFAPMFGMSHMIAAVADEAIAKVK